MLNRRVLSRDRKTATEGAEVTRSGRLFQTRAAATGKARSPTVDGRVRLTIDDEVDSVPAFRVKLGASDLNFVDV